MAKIHAFMSRDWFTCYECDSLTWRGLSPYCRHNRCQIRWDPEGFGCGSYASGARER
nr:MAG TPA: hypothetical protein [Caudoviricetes sp.]